MRSTENETRQWVTGGRRTDAGRVLFTSHSTTIALNCQDPPPPDLRDQDYTRYWAARRRYLLEQAAAYTMGGLQCETN